jgi:outer membrane receptor protein involved in Fe transport
MKEDSARLMPHDGLEDWGVSSSDQSRNLPMLVVAAFFTVLFLASGLARAQSANTGALAGVVTDPSGGVSPGVRIKAINEATGETREVVTQPRGNYSVPLLSPGTYRVEASAPGFALAVQTGVRISVTETARLDIRMAVSSVAQSVTVEAHASLVETESSALGRVTDEQTITSLPLVTRNYTQIIGLSPGVSQDVTNAAELGRGNGGTIFGASSSSPFDPAGFNVDGARFTDNNFQMNGVPVNDVAGFGANSGGVAIPNPDTIQEFKVQTGQYDATYGRNGGANVDLITKGGTNQYHGTAFEYLRNKDLNANDFFFNRNGVPRPDLTQNIFGGTLGGPIVKDKLFFFGSYQGTHQRNGVGSSCGATSVIPAQLTNDRTAATIAQEFAGQRGVFQGPPFFPTPVGPAIDPSNSPGDIFPYNINPVALNLLQLKLANGNYVIPTPQSIQGGVGSVSFSLPCHFTENQYMTNANYVVSEKDTVSFRFFSASGKTTETIPGGTGSTTAASVPGFPSNIADEFRNLSITETHTFSTNVLNEAAFGFHRTNGNLIQNSAFTYSDIGATVPPLEQLPQIAIFGEFALGNNFPEHTVQNAFIGQDSVSWIRGRQLLRFGGNVERYQLNESGYHSPVTIDFLSFPDFLLGLSGAQNGTGFLSNIYQSADLPGLTDRAIRMTNAALYAQDDIKITRTFTLNLGVRYERISQAADKGGRLAGFNVAQAVPNPPAGGTIAGYVVASNFRGTIPAGVAKASNEFATEGLGQNAIEPRVGFAWQVLPGSHAVVLRGGYGMFESPLVGQQFAQNWFVPPFAESRSFAGPTGAAVTFQNPVPPAPTFPVFPSYSPFTALVTSFLNQRIRPGVSQHYSLNLQSQIARSLLLEVGYIGSRGTRLLRDRSLNQALLASPTNSVRGLTENTLMNTSERVPILGFTPQGLVNIESEGASWYNAGVVSLSKRFTQGLQFLVSYTFARSMDTDAGDVGLSSGGNNLPFGNQNNPDSNYGPSGLVRPHRLVVSYLYELPGPAKKGFASKFLGGWAVSGVTTYQSGHPMFLVGVNGTSAYGIALDRPEFAPGCDRSKVATSGSVESKLNNYFNQSCFTSFPLLPASQGGDGTVTGFGNAGNGIIRGPGQADWDMAIIKKTSTSWLNEASNVEFRAEFFNAFNHPQFADPFPGIGLPGSGVITGTSVAPRIMQFALKFSF